jgi:hypothetical protein
VAQADSLDGPRAKLDRAKAHYLNLHREVRPGGTLQHCPVEVKPEGHSLEYSVSISRTQKVSNQWPLMIGDCLFDLRAALDHLVFQLHVRRFRGRLPPGLEDSTAFPILYRPPGPNYRWEKIGRLATRQQTAIKHLQPYKGGHGELGHLRANLGLINTLNNIDKHRHLHVIWFCVGMVAVPVFPPQYGFRRTRCYSSDTSLVAGTIIERWAFSELPPEVNVHGGAFGDIRLAEAYGPGSFPVEVVPLLERLIESTETVIDRFAKYFRSDP